MGEQSDPVEFSVWQHPRSARVYTLLMEIGNGGLRLGGPEPTATGAVQVARFELSQHMLTLLTLLLEDACKTREDQEMSAEAGEAE